MNMPKRSRLSRYKNADIMHRQNRLDMIAKKKAMVKDILSLSGQSVLEELEADYCALGDNLEERLMSLSPMTISKIHKRVIDFDAQPTPIPPDEGIF